MCAPRAESESRETGKRPSTGPGGRWPHGVTRVAKRDGRAGRGFSRLFTPRLWSDLPGARLVLAFPPPCDSRGAVGRPGVSASGFQAARVGSIRVRCATVSRDGRMRETDDDVLDRQGIHPAPSGSATEVRGPGPLHRPRGERERHPVTTRSRPVQSDRAAQPLKTGLVQR